MNGDEAVQPRNWKEARRMRAWELKKRGWKQKDIAEALGVSDGAVSQWLAKARANGCKALRSRRGGGPKPRLSNEQLAQLPSLLAQDPREFGFDRDRWTHSLVAKVIRQEFGVSYTPTHVGRILKKIDWSE